MPLTDTPYLAADSLLPLSADTLPATDTLVQVAETATTVPASAIVYDGIEKISTPASESWVFLICAGLFFMFVLLIRLGSGAMIEEIKTFF